MIEDIRKDHAKLAYRDAEGSLTTEAVVEFLNKTLGRIRRLRDISELREALRYFRKWKRWLISERRFYYFQDVSIPAAHFVRQGSLQNTRREQAVQTPFDRATLIALTEMASPEIEERTIEAIERGFITKSQTYPLLKESETYFKRGLLQRSHEKAVEVLDSLSEQQQLDNLEWYFSAWALHILSKIFFVRKDLDRACSAAFLSWSYKSKISVLPELNKLASEVKWKYFFWLRHRRYNLRTGLSELSRRLSSPAVRTHNTLWAENLDADIKTYYATHAIYNHENEDADSQLRSAERVARRAGDTIGVVRSSFLTYFRDDNLKAFSRKTEAALESDMNARSHPYIRGFQTLLTAELREPLPTRHLRETFSIFRDFGIVPFAREDYGYSVRHLRRRITITLKASKAPYTPDFII